MRLALLAAALCLLSAAALAQPAPPTDAAARPEVLNRIYACADNHNDQERLACYDAAVGNLRQAEQQGDVVAVDRAQVRRVEREGFGFSLPSLGSLMPHRAAEPALSEVTLHVTRIANRQGDILAFVMDNGQIWTQTEAKTSNIRVGDEVRVQRSGMGGYFLLSPHGGSGLRVRREN